MRVSLGLNFLIGLSPTLRNACSNKNNAKDAKESRQKVSSQLPQCHPNACPPIESAFRILQKHNPNCQALSVVRQWSMKMPV